MHYKYRPFVTKGANGTTVFHRSTEDNPVLDLGKIDDYVYIYSATPLVEQNELLNFVGVTLSLDEISQLNNQRFMINPTDEVKGLMQYSQAAAVIQKVLDNTANKLGYDSINSAIIYVGSPNSQYNDEAQKLRDWKSDVWTFANSDEAKSAETMEELLNSLPEFVL